MMNKAFPKRNCVFTSLTHHSKFTINSSFTFSSVIALARQHGEKNETWRRVDVKGQELARRYSYYERCGRMA